MIKKGDVVKIKNNHETLSNFDKKRFAGKKVTVKEVYQTEEIEFTIEGSSYLFLETDIENKVDNEKVYTWIKRITISMYKGKARVVVFTEYRNFVIMNTDINVIVASLFKLIFDGFKITTLDDVKLIPCLLEITNDEVVGIYHFMSGYNIRITSETLIERR